MTNIRITAGSEVDHCEICDEQITIDNPGWQWSYQRNGYLYKVRVCDSCFNETDYQEIISRIYVIEVSLYPRELLIYNHSDNGFNVKISTKDQH
jgi:hypothetical protein